MKKISEPTAHHSLTTRQPQRIVLGITGGVAAYKSAELVRLLKKANIDVRVVLTAAGERFITATTVLALSGNPVFTSLWDERAINGQANGMAHIELSRDADAILIAPASADFIAKLAHGLADDLLSTLCLARNVTRCKLIVAPAMNREMWENPTTQRNVERLREDGIEIIGPAAGEQACGEVGLGRLLEPTDILAAVQAFYSQITLEPAAHPLAGKRIIVTAGPTVEPIDPVRSLTNGSSGKMGYAIATALIEAGARVTLVSGPTALETPPQAQVVQVQTAADMLSAVMAVIADADLFFAVAAVADYTPAQPQTQKIKKQVDNLTLTLKPTQDILATVASLPTPPFCVGFAAESQNVLDYARQKRIKKRIPLIVANLATRAMGADENEVTLIDDQGEHVLPVAHKDEIARQIVAHATHLYLKQS